MTDQLRFDGRVVVVTGAGGGLGKVYALFFAERGASVVVNDLGGSFDGKGASSRAADVVVEEIIAKGGKAVANYNSVDDGDKIIETAIKAFGRVDVVINNAGILRDKTLARMTDDDWESVYRVHVRGSYKVTAAAWPYMMQQKFGRIINTASAAGINLCTLANETLGIYGNVGQSQYSAAKLGLHGFTMSLALEGAKNNIRATTIAPVAASRMTETIMPKELLAALKPEFVAPLVGYLTHESVNPRESGALFEVGGGWIARLRRERSKGAIFHADQTFTPGAVAARWAEINDFKNPEYPAKLTDVDWLGNLDKAKNGPGNPVGPEIRFDNRVAVVTGAGAGLGRAYALLLAKLGCKVVCNDLGGGFKGDGASSSAADKVVEEIRQAGGTAVANYNSVTDGDKIIETAMKAFGRVDILINNAGILRDKSFAKMTEQDWDIIQDVHVKGVYKTTKAAWDIMRQQKYGRIVNTSSAVGLFGNYGQCNYSTAKAATIGFSNTLYQEGAKSNIIVNTLAPNAGTRMTATVMPPEMVEALKPEYVAPLVAYLVSDMNKITGGVYECGAGWVARVRWQRSGGYGFPVGSPLTPEQVASKMDIIDTFDSRATYPLTPQDSISQVLANVNSKGGLGGGNASKISGAPGSGAAGGPAPTSIDLEAAKALSLPATKMDYTEKDVILYALGVGAKRTELDLVYENAGDFKVLPTFGVLPAFPVMTAFPFGQVLPKFNPMMLLHGEQYLEMRGTFPTHGQLETTAQILDIQDKGKGVTVVLAATTKDAATGKDICYNEFTTFIRGVPGQGASKTSQDRGAATAANTPPSRKPDAVVTEKTSEEQAALYRLSGDNNPLHIDPAMSKMGGFDVPILHGLCTFGIASKHVLRKFANSDPAQIASIKARFVKSVYPGETLETSMWKEGNTVYFQVKVLERNEIVLANAAAVLGSPKAAPKAEGGQINVPGFKSSAVFGQIKATMDARNAEERKKQVSSVNGVFCMDVTNAEGKQASWFIDLKNGTGMVGGGKPTKADLTITVSDDDFVSLATGKLNPQKAFTSGKIKVKGNIMLATKLGSVLGSSAKL